MLHFGSFEIDTTVFVFIVSVLVLLIQLLLCFKVKSLLIRLIPTILFLSAAVIFAIMIAFSSGWDSIGWLFISLCCAFVALFCAIGWGIFGIVKIIKKKK